MQFTSANGEIAINSTLKVSESATAGGKVSAAGGTSGLTSNKTTGTVTLRSAGGAILVNGGRLTADRGTIDVRNPGAAGLVQLNAALLAADVIKAGALGTDGQCEHQRQPHPHRRPDRANRRRRPGAEPRPDERAYRQRPIWRGRGRRKIPEFRHDRTPFRRAAVLGVFFHAETAARVALTIFSVHRLTAPGGPLVSRLARPATHVKHHKPTHECGVFAVFGHPNAAVLTYYGLFALQHRGQESAGIVTADGPNTPFNRHVAMGLVSQVFNPPDLERLKGTRAIGHVRYSTTGSSNLTNAQPLMVDCARGQLAIGHNGNLVNAAVLRDELEQQGSIFQTTVDSEIILHLLAQPRDSNGVLAALRKIQGAFSLVMMGEQQIIGVRDPFGFRPLSLGMLEGAYVLSSETCAFDLIHAEFIRDIEPGEVVIIDKNGIRSEFPFKAEKRAFCMFEYVYFARPDSIINDINVARVRTAMGRELARLHPVEADLVVPVPDSGNYAALGFAEELGIPYNHAFVRNHYIGRTFLQPTQFIRDFNVRVKLNLIKEAVAGKRVVVVDDSIVRGTTARARVVNLREAGAKEVHMRISCPPHKHACHYGIDFPDPEKLLANQCTLEQIRDYLGADSIGYLDVDGMVRATGQEEKNFCLACFNADYPVPVDPTLDKFIMERRQGRKDLLGDDDQPELFDKVF